MYKPPFIVISNEPTIACFGGFATLEEARDYVKKLQELGLCMSGCIGCYRNEKFVRVEEIDSDWDEF